MMKEIQDHQVMLVDSRIDKHEAVCAERWKAIIDKVSRLEKVILLATASLLSGMAIVIWQILIKGIHITYGVG
jgi:predicted nucleic acid-binding Zn ribbon protein